MNISFEQKSATLGTIKVTINKTDYQPVVDQKIVDHSKAATLKGFRKGKVPFALIRKLYGPALIVEEINKLVADKLNSYLSSSGTYFLGEPVFQKPDQPYDWESQEEFNFNYRVGFAKPFDVKISKDLRIDKHIIKIDNSIMDEMIETEQRLLGKKENPDISNESDKLYGELSTDGIIREITIDPGLVEETTAKKLSGIRIGAEVSLDIKKLFKDENVLRHQLAMSGEDLEKIHRCTFKLKRIDHHKLMPVGQKLFDKLFGDGTVKNEAEFREKFKEYLKQRFGNESDDLFEFRIQKQIIEDAKIELPDEFLKDWLISLNANLPAEQLAHDYEMYAERLRWELIQKKISKDQGISTDHGEVVNEAENIIKKTFAKMDPREMNGRIKTLVKDYLQGESGENYKRILGRIQKNKVFDFIKERIEIREKSVSYKEFKSLLPNQ